MFNDLDITLGHNLLDNLSRTRWISQVLGCFSLHMPRALTPVDSQHLALAVLRF